MEAVDNGQAKQGGVVHLMDCTEADRPDYLQDTWLSKARVKSILFPSLAGYWCQSADERFGDPPRWIQEPLVVRDRNGRPQEDPLAVHCLRECTVGRSPWGKQIDPGM